MDPLSTQWPAYVRWTPASMIVAGVAFDLLAPPEYWGDALLAAACVAAGATISLQGTVVICAAALAGVVALSATHGNLGHGLGYLELGNVAFTTFVGIGVNRVIARHGRRLEVVRTVAETAQRAVLPAPPDRIGPLTVAARYKAAHVEARIGGDAYAVQHSPYGTRVLIADVRGKGLGAVGAVSVLLGAFREAAGRAPDLPALAERLEQALLRESERRDDEETTLEGFTTALLGEFDPDAGVLRLLNRGHPSPYLLHGGVVQALDPGEADLPLGMTALGAPTSGPDDWAFPVGGTLLLVTDGVTEARDSAGAFYDPAERLAGRGPFRRPREVIDVLVRDVEGWTAGHRADDMAVLAVTRQPPRPPCR